MTIHTSQIKGLVAGIAVKVNTETSNQTDRWLRVARVSTAQAADTSQSVFLFSFPGYDYHTNNRHRNEFIVTVRYTPRSEAPYAYTTGTILEVSSINANETDGWNPTTDIALLYNNEDTTYGAELWVKCTNKNGQVMVTPLSSTVESGSGSDYNNLGFEIIDGESTTNNYVASLPAEHIRNTADNADVDYAVVYGTWSDKIVGSLTLADNVIKASDGGTAITLDTSSNVTLSAKLRVPQYIEHNGDTDTRINFSTANKMVLEAGGLDMISISESTQDAVVVNDGGADVDFRVEGSSDANAFFVRGSDNNVGIGTNSPGSDLEVYNAGVTEVRITGNNTGDTRLRIDNGSSDHYIFDDQDDSNNFKIESASSKALCFNTNGPNERMRITSDGKVGIGTNDPKQNFVVQGDNSVIRIANNNNDGDDYSGRLEISEDTNASGVMTHGAFFHYEGTSTTNELWIGTRNNSTSDVKILRIDRESLGDSIRVTSTGVGIGVSAPSTKLDVDGTVTATSFAGSFAGNVTGPGQSTFLGNVGIGTATPGARLHVKNHMAAPDDLGDWDNYQIVIEGHHDTGDAAGILFTTTTDTYGGSAIVHHDAAGSGIGNLIFYTKQSVSNVPPLEVLKLGHDGSSKFTKRVAADGAVDIVLQLEASDPTQVRNLNAGNGTALQFLVPEDSGSALGAQIVAQRETTVDTDTSSGLGLWTYADDASGSEKVRITSAGKVGIGTSTPSQALHLNMTIADGMGGILMTKSGATVADDHLGGIAFDSTDGNVPSQITEASAFIAAYASENHGTLDKGGYLVFGTSKTNDNDDTTGHKWVYLRNQGGFYINGTGAAFDATRADYGHLNVLQPADDQNNGMTVMNVAGTTLRMWVDGSSVRHIDAGGNGNGHLIINRSPGVDNVGLVTVGNMNIHTWNDGNYFGLGHKDNLSNYQTYYALLQSDAGKTFINSASGQSINFRTNNDNTAANVMTFQDGLLTVGTKILCSGVGQFRNNMNVQGGNSSVDNNPLLSLNHYYEHTSNFDLGDKLGEICWRHSTSDNQTAGNKTGMIRLSVAEGGDPDYRPASRMDFHIGRDANIGGTDRERYLRHIMRISSAGVAFGYANGETRNAAAPVTINSQASGANASAQGGIRIYEHHSVSSPEYWAIGVSSTPALHFKRNGSSTAGGYLFGTVVNEIDFTGQHRSMVADGESLSDYSDKIGLIVVSSGEYYNLPVSGSDGFSTPDHKPNINESLPKVTLSSLRNQKSVYGVISDTEDFSQGESSGREYTTGAFVSCYDAPLSDQRLIVNALGEGAIWVCNINGNLENGDYIASCEIPGYGMKQDDDLMHNYTVAKITQDCDFDLNSTNYDVVEFDHEGQTLRKAFVGCTYHCG